MAECRHEEALHVSRSLLISDSHHLLDLYYEFKFFLDEAVD